MVGQLDSGQDKLFYSFNLDNHVPRTHLLQGINNFLDLGDLRRHLAPFYYVQIVKAVMIWLATLTLFVLVGSRRCGHDFHARVGPAATRVATGECARSLCWLSKR